MILIDINKGDVYSNLMRLSSFLTNKVYDYEEKNKKSVKKILFVEKIKSNSDLDYHFMDCNDEYVDIFTFFTPNLFTKYNSILLELNSLNEIVIKLLNDESELIYNIFLISNLKYLELKDLEVLTSKNLKDINSLKKNRKKMILDFNTTYHGLTDDIKNQFKKDNFSIDYSLDEGVNWSKMHLGNNLESEIFKNALYRASYI